MTPSGLRGARPGRRRDDRDGPRVLVCSAAGLLGEGVSLNVGDEALTVWLVRALRARLPGAVVTSTLNPGPTPVSALPSDRVAVRPYQALALAIARADVVVLGGGTLLQEDYKDYPLLSGLLRYAFFVSTVARIARVPVVIAGIGAEGLTHRNSRWAARRIVRRAAGVVVRDEYSARLLREVSGRPVGVGADVMFLPGPDRPAVAPTGRRRITVSLRGDAPEALVASLARLLEEQLSAGAVVTLVATHRDAHDDVVALRRLREALPAGAAVDLMPETATWEEVYAVAADSELCIGMRLHFLIFAALAGRPTLALTVAATPKSTSFVEDLGCRRSTSDATPASWPGRRTRRLPRIPSVSPLSPSGPPRCSTRSRRSCGAGGAGARSAAGLDLGEQPRVVGSGVRPAPAPRLLEPPLGEARDPVGVLAERGHRGAPAPGVQRPLHVAHGVPGHLADRRDVAGQHGGAGGHGLEDGKAEALDETWEGEGEGVPVEAGELLRGDEAEVVHPLLEPEAGDDRRDVGALVVRGRAGEDEVDGSAVRDARHAAHERRHVLVAHQAAHVQDERGLPGRRGGVRRPRRPDPRRTPSPMTEHRAGSTPRNPWRYSRVALLTQTTRVAVAVTRDRPTR
jgi:polysaccharide pyruvyl transferase WcaK-like protein